jgi:succinyl-CoA synthetase beta subunit
MNVHEDQAKELLRSYGVPVPNGLAAFTVEEAVDASELLSGAIKVVKAQIHAGGRGKAGGVKLAKSQEEVKEYATELLGNTLVTHQTGPEGKVVQRLLVEEGCAIDKAYYLGIVLDGVTGRVVIMGSSEGGMDIDEVAEVTPEKIIKEVVDPAVGLQGFLARKLAFAMGVPVKLVNKFVGLGTKLYNFFVDKDCSIAEINPLVTTKDGEVLALDAKLNFDSNAIYRHSAIVALRDETEEDPRQVEASKSDLNCIALDGTIGCLVNGAGPAMATMDIIKQFSGDPAHFLDVGGGATKEKVTEAFKLILSDGNVKGIDVNIFGGIMKCDVIEEGIVAATKEVGLELPLVVRLEGTNVDAGKQIIKDSGITITAATSMADGAEKIAALVKLGEAKDEYLGERIDESHYSRGYR